MNSKNEETMLSEDVSDVDGIVDANQDAAERNDEHLTMWIQGI